MNKKESPLRNRLSLIALIIVLVSISLLASCTKADATSKKDKTKQSKAKPEPDPDETGNTEEKTNTETEKTDPKTANTKTAADTVANTAETKKTEPSKGPVKKGEKPPESKDVKNAAKTPAKDVNAAGNAIWKELVKGNKRFMAGTHTGVNYSSARNSLVKSQSPDVVVLGCSDSRVPPEFVFDKNLGELFVVRDAGNIADKVSLGSIEYAVEHLHSKVLVVLGHESCGAVAATVSGEKLPSANLTAIIDSISPAFAGSKTCVIGGESNLSCVELNVRQSSKDILAKSAILKKAVDDGRLTIIRAVYKMATGEVIRLD